MANRQNGWQRNIMADYSDLDMAIAVLRVKTDRYTELYKYYEGRQPLVYSSERLKDVFNDLNARFTQNWCAVVVDSVQDRLALQSINVVDNDAPTAQLNDLLTNSDLLLEADDVHNAVLVTGEAYVIAWPDEMTNQPEAFCNDPRNVHIFYEADNPRRKRFAAKWWIGDDDHRYITLYYPDRFEYYRSLNTVRNRSDGLPTAGTEVQNGKAFGDPATANNDWGIVPVFHFRRDRQRTRGELENIIQPQDAVNKLLADMMVAAEFGAYKQRWIISDADTSKMKNGPNLIWNIPAGDGEMQPTSVGEFDITPLDNYLKAVDKWVTSIAIISRTPKHYFYGQGGDPSGEALIALEAPLNKKVQAYIDHFLPTWSELGVFMLRLLNVTVDDNAVVPVYDKPETVQPLTRAMIRKTNVDAGVPLMWQLKDEGYTDEELADVQAAKDEAMQQQQETLAAAMTNAQRNFDQGPNNNQSA